MIGINNIHLSFGGTPILKGVTMGVQDEECIAVVGPNGCGKSTLLRIIAGLEEPDAGEIHMPSKTTIGYLPQEANLDADRTLQEELLDAFGQVQAAMAEMSDLEHDMAVLDPSSPNYEGILERYSELAHLVEHQDGYALESVVRRVAAGLGFAPDDFDRYCSEFSGGWKMRILLAKVLLQKPDILLLDEPTNHLDLETMLWLEEWIRTCKRTVIMVSHERSFMDRLVNRVVCLEQGEADIYRGDYSHYVTQSAIKRDAHWDAYQRQQEEIEATLAFIRKFRYNAARAAQVQSRARQLEKIERLTPPFHPTAIHFDFPPAPPSHRDVVVLDSVSHSYDDHEVLHDINLTIMKGEKVGLVGVNGAGKSTLLRIISEREEPVAGRCTIGGKVSPAYFAQYDLDSLTSSQSLLQAIESTAPTGAAGRARDVLGAFLFTGDDVEKPLRALSGGERTRFRLAQMLFSPANLLILDEPTNHLDVTSRATVEEALRDYSGTVIVVSHDPVFMNCVTNRIVEIIDGKLHTYPGCYNDYLAYKEKLAAEQAAGDGVELTSKPTTQKPSSAAPPKPTKVIEPKVEIDPREQRRLEREASKARERKIRQVERAIETIETEIERDEHRIDELNLMMADPVVAGDYSKLAPLTEEHRVVSARRAESLAKWETLQAELEECAEAE